MPQLTLEYSSNLLAEHALEPATTLTALNAALAATGEVNEYDIKSRAHRCDVFAVGTAPAQRAFVHVKVGLMTGRTPDTKRRLSQILMDALRTQVSAATSLDTQLCVEIVDIDRESYVKVRI